MEFIKSLLASNLRELRKSKSLSQVDIAKSIGVSQASYARWESGEWISPESLEKLALFYGVRSSRFFYDPDMENPATYSRPNPKEIIKDLQAIIDKLS